MKGRKGEGAKGGKGEETVLSPLPPFAPSPLLFLTGYRGTGKSTVARLLAGRLGWRWVDADDVVEERAGRTIRQIFEDEGEAGFRRRESAVLEELCGLAGHVIATGGGAVLSPANRERMRRAGRVVWLTAEPETIRRRLDDDAATAARRPNLTVGGLPEIKELLKAREPLYRAAADVAIATDGRTPEDVAAAVLFSLNLG